MRQLVDWPGEEVIGARFGCGHVPGSECSTK